MDEHGNEKAPRGLDFWLPIGIAAVALVGVAIMVITSWPKENSTPASGVSPGGTPALMPPPAAPPAIQSPRMVADELFNRAMMAHETGQAQQAATLLPEAIAAYRSLHRSNPALARASHGAPALDGHAGRVPLDMRSNGTLTQAWAS